MRITIHMKPKKNPLVVQNKDDIKTVITRCIVKPELEGTVPLYVSFIKTNKKDLITFFETSITKPETEDSKERRLDEIFSKLCKAQLIDLETDKRISSANKSIEIEGRTTGFLIEKFDPKKTYSQKNTLNLKDEKTNLIIVTEVHVVLEADDLNFTIYISNWPGFKQHKNDYAIEVKDSLFTIYTNGSKQPETTQFEYSE